tara:strand:+ start:103 stop:1176 length:1074 start_codon:yes stop_codon:yes gene_type:complete
MPRNIAFIGPIPPPVGGVALANLRVQELVRTHHPKDVILTLNTSKGLTNADLYKKKGIGELLHFIKNIFQLIRFIAKNRIDVSNVFVVPNISFLREMIFICILKLTTKKLVVHLHAKTEGDYFLSGFKLKIFTKVVGLGDIIFVLSEKFHKQFYSQFIDEKKLIVLENFVNYRNFDTNISDKTNDFLYVGRLSEKKGFLDLVEAVILIKDEVKNLTIHVLGAYENETFKTLIETKIKRNQLNNFKFYGAKTGAEKFEFFKKNSVFVFPSYFENSPIVLKEAIAAKMAILSSDIIENKNILDPFSIKEYFKTRNIQDLAEKIKKLHNHKELVTSYMNNAEKVTHFGYDYAGKIIKKHL